MSSHAEAAAPQLSVIMCTYNRGHLLEDAVRSVLDQDEATLPRFEMVVVDNNSTDGTRETVERFARTDGRVRYLFEPRQGLSHARNAGIAAARAPLVAFTDDDVRVNRDWAAAVVRAFEEYPEADMIGGRVLPLWPTVPPAWLTFDHWTPLALADHGDQPFELTVERDLCLVGANLSFRRRAFAIAGPFASEFQRVKDSIGSLEDHEFELRLLRSGGRGFYDPRIVVHAEIQPDRLERAYHRRWYTGHGHYMALLLRSEHLEKAHATLSGVPPYLYRRAAVDLVGWVRALASRRPGRAFHFELRLRFFYGFLRTRRREYLAKPRHERRREMARLLRHRLRRALPLWNAARSSGAGEGRA